MANPQPGSGQSTPQPAPAEIIAKGRTVQEFCISVAQTLLKQRVFTHTSTSPKTKGAVPSKYAIFQLGPGANTLYSKEQELDAEQSRSLPTEEGVPQTLAFKIVLLKLTPASVVEAGKMQRLAATAQRQSGQASRMSESTLLEGLNAKRIAQGKKPLTQEELDLLAG